MPSVTYGGSNGQSVEFETSDDLLVLRTRSQRSLRSRVVGVPESDNLQDFEFAFGFPEAGVEVFRRSQRAGAKSAVESARKNLNKAPDTRFAGRVLIEKTSGEPVIYTENLFVKFHDNCTSGHCQDILDEVGLTVKRPLTYARNAYFVEAPEGTGQRVFDIAASLLEREDMEFCHPELVRRKQLRTVFDQQWHLKSTTINGQAINASANVEAALAESLGDGITIAIIDDGVDVDHEEFSSAGKIVAPRDMRFPTSDPRHADPRPRPGENHGTACAGVACADGRFGASGVAPRARLMPIRSVSSLGSQAEADAFHWAADNGASVISCSWGPPDGRWWLDSDPLHQQVFPLPDSTRLAIEYAVQNGRDGKGCVIFWAAGNGNESADNDGYATNPRVYAVAACNDTGKRSVYSDFGDCVFCSFPSSDFGYAPFNHPEPLTPGIWTTDRSGRAGYNEGSAVNGDLAGNYTNSFGGTSSSAPGAAGVAALVLAKNPELRWDEVGAVLRQCCDRVDPANADYVDGRSKFYGYGRLNALRAVRLAEPETLNDSIAISASFATPVLDFQRSEVTLNVGESRKLRDVKIMVDIRHTYIGDLRVTVVPPPSSGVAEIVLHDRAGRSGHNINRTFDSSTISDLRQLNDVNPKGIWTLKVEDFARRDQGAIRRFGLELVPVVERSPAVPASSDMLAMSESRNSKTPAPGRKRRSRKAAKA